ncbi:hypothetical protein J2Y03_003930 [Neobacillus niacini]|nr:hypothetical protein [Neobacillus niacini]
MRKDQKQGLKLTGILYNAVIIGSVIVALTSGFRLV